MTKQPALVLLLVLGAASCSVDLAVPDDARVTCASDADCPAGFACNPGILRCVPPEGLGVGCGNFIIDDGEVCDDGNSEGGDGCSSDCRSQETCGNAIVDTAAGETCDCGDGSVALPLSGCPTANADTPSATCRSNCQRPGCGDGVITPPEECEGTDLGTADCELLGYYGGTLACSSFCRFDETACVGLCGDDVKNGDEVCDGTDLGGESCVSLGFYDDTPALACTASCSFDISACTGTCGDLVQNGDEGCDGTDLAGRTCLDFGFYQPNGLTCTASCAFNTSACVEYCGDAIVNGVEVCDGAPPPNQTCVGYGFDFGTLGCSYCAPGMETCERRGVRAIPPADSSPFSAMALAGPRDLYLGTTVGLRRFDGSAWSTPLPITSDPIYAIWAPHPDLIVIAQNTTFRHWNGTSWTTYNAPYRVATLWGAASNDIHATTATGPNAGKVLHFDGSGWTELTSPSPQLMNALWGADANNVFAAGNGGTIIRYHDGAWSLMTSNTGNTLYGIWGSSASNVIAVGDFGTLDRWNGGTWTVETTGLDKVYKAIDGISADDYWIARYAPRLGSPTGELQHNTGKTAWTVVPTTDLQNRFGRVLAAASGEIYTASDSNTNIMRLDFGHTRTTLLPGGNAADMKAAWAADDGRIFAVGAAGYVARYDGVAWIEGTDGAAVLEDVWGSSPSNVYAVASGAVTQWTGSMWNNVTPATGTGWRALGGTAFDNVYAAGTRVARFDGGMWTVLPDHGNVEPPLDVFGTGLGDVTVLTNKGSVLHYDGMNWQTLKVGAYNPSNIYDGWIDPVSRHAYLSGYLILAHFDGSNWIDQIDQLPLAASNYMFAIGGTGTSDIFSGRFGGALFHTDGVRWEPLTGPLTKTVNGFANNTFGLTVAVTDDGYVHEHQRISFDRCADYAWLGCGDVVTATNQGGNRDRASYPCASRAEPGPARHYRLSGLSGSVTVDLHTTLVDLDLVILESGAPTCQPNSGCLDASTAGGATDTVTFTASPGAHYYVVVESPTEASGSFQLQVTCN